MNKNPEYKHVVPHKHVAPKRVRFAFRQKWKTLTIALSVCVAVGTVGALMLPAITLTRPECEITEHVHDDNCYQSIMEPSLQCDAHSQVHSHSPACYSAGNELVCGYGDKLIHTHDALCYDNETGGLICLLSELGVHQHSEICYSAPQTVLDEGHTHGDVCYSWVPSIEPTCGIEEAVGHSHNEACFTSAMPICGLEESSGHQHGEGCYSVSQAVPNEGTAPAEADYSLAQSTELICGIAESMGHSHNEACFISAAPICGLEENAGHMHDENCNGLVRGELICTETEREAVTESGEAVLICTLPEIIPHTHTEACFADGVLTCGMTEWIAHQHTEACFSEAEEKELICELEEHTHSSDCTSYPEADLESAAVWEATLPTLLTGDYAVDVLRIARSQLGYHESTNNYMLSDYGVRMGYTRYGAWYGGDAYDDWCAMFVSFCIRYAGLTDYPVEAGCDKWIAALRTLSEQSALEHETDPENAFTYYMDAYTGYQPVPGDFVFFDMDGDGSSDHVGLIEQYVPAAETEPASLLTIEGNSADMVQYAVHTVAEPAIIGYGRLPAQDFSCGLTGHVHDAYCGGCTLEEHIHTAGCLPKADESADETDSERKFEVISAAYITTVTAPAGAELPEDTVISAEPLFDSNEPMIAAFSLDPEASSAPDSSAWVEAIMNAITWGEVTRIKLFDISLSSAEGEVQPNAPVQVRTQFAEPLYIAEGEVVYGVHFGVNGVEILPAETERNINGEIIAITHTQASFSTTGYVLVHTTNPADAAPDVLPVHYCIWVNNQWVIVGSSRTGWYGDYNFREEWPPKDNQRDYITVDQLYAALKNYGLILKEDSNDNLILSSENIKLLSETIWYQRAEDDPTTHTDIRHDTKVEQRKVTLANGETQTKWVFPLSANRIKDDGYHIYFVPGGTLSNSEANPSATYHNNAALGADLADKSKYYSVEVRDMSGIVYDGSTTEKQQNQIPAAQYIQSGKMIFVDVLPNGEMGWQWMNSRGELVWTRDDDSPESFYYEEAGENGKETYGVLGISERMTLIPYSVAVDGAESNKEHMVDIMVHLDGEWQNIGHVSVLYQKEGLCGGRWFITAGQLYAYLKDFGFTVDSYKPDDVQDAFHKFTYAYGRADQLEIADMPMFVCDSNSAVSHNNNNNTIAIGLGTEDDTAPQDYTIFYIPGSDDEAFDDVHGQGALDYAESDKIKGDRFYSIKVVDDYQLVYYSYETDNFLVYAPEGQSVSVSVENALSVLWSVREPWKTERPEQYVKTECKYSFDDSFKIYEFEAVNGPQIIEASSLNPHYSVQYFANIERYQLYDADNPAPGLNVQLIDTEFGLPTNGDKNLPLKYLGLKGTSASYMVDTYVDNAEIYKQTDYVYDRAHFWDNIDKLYDNDHYIIGELWILKDGRDPLSTDEKDFWIYKVTDAHDNIEFTNLPSEEYAPKDEENNIQEGEDYVILITEGMIMRLHYTLAESTSTNNNVAFYDYDVSSNGESRVRQGINSIHGSHTGSGYAGYAFGNNNAGTETGDYSWNGNSLNTYNHSGNGFSGCTFGLVTGRNADGTLNFANGVTAPTIFAGTKPNGRRDFTGSLTFARKGDVYTLSASSVGSGSRSGLQNFFNPTSADGTLYSHIYTNNFWALDGAPGTDGLGGGPGEDHEWIPDSDDGQNHNSYFGMNFAIEFSLTNDYIGPMEYIFFGDDDMWVFLDGQLICDIGGVHSAVGEYVDLRKYIPEGTGAGRHKLEFYYVERGASGSTCWMSFTLPSVTYTTVEKGTSEIVITKSLKGVDGSPVKSPERYEFTLRLFTGKDKETELFTSFSAQIDRADGDPDYFSFESGDALRIGAGDTARVLGLPIGTWYVVTEKEDDRFNVVANGKEGWVVEGSTSESSMEADYVNIQKGYILPNTGGSGSTPYILGGIALLGAVLLIYKKRRLIHRGEG